MIVVLDMRDSRPAWAMPSWVPERIRSAIERTGGGELRVLDVVSDGSGDGAARIDPEVLEAVADADVYLGYGVAPEVVSAGVSLKWVHSGAAGVGSSLGPELRAADLVFTNSAGIHGPPMAETVVGMILHFLRGLDYAVESGRDARWDTSGFYGKADRIRELSECTVGIVGFGGVGREVARRCHSFGARIVAMRRTSARDEVVEISQFEGESSPASSFSVTVLGPPDPLGRLASQSDVLVVTVPGTPATRGMVGGDVLAKLPAGAIVVNVARGGVVDEAALLAQLDSGAIRGAALDVFSEEPLPRGSPLWSRRGVLVTPHVSAVTSGYWKRQVALIEENIDAFAAGRPLRNVVDRAAGY